MAIDKQYVDHDYSGKKEDDKHKGKDVKQLLGEIEKQKLEFNKLHSKK